MPKHAQPLQKSAILTPISLTKTEHVITEAEFVKLRRVMGWARTQGMKAMYFCDQCKERVDLKAEQPLTITDTTAPPTLRRRLECACSRWVIR